MHKPAFALFLCLTLACALEPAHAMDDRTRIHHLLRRFAFSGSPAEVTQIRQAGIDAWLTSQLHPDDGQDDVADNRMEPAPLLTNAKGEVEDYPVYQRRLVEREIFTKWQVREKLTLHWLEHFSVGVSKVGDWPMMARYEGTLRANALGNFRTMLTAVSTEPAMLMWLDNDYNDGAQSSPPNENFARELLQLYVMGTDKIGADGTPSGKPAYTQADVREVAKALTGWGVDCNDDAKVKNPNTRCTVSFHTELHRKGIRRILGSVIDDDGSRRTLARVIGVLAHDPTTSMFQARELLQRFVTDTPSAQYVARIARVWAAGVDAPDQIARVIRAIVRDPEFDGSYHQLVKEPIELYVGLLRQLPVVFKDAKDDGGAVPPCSEVVSDGGGLLFAAGQQPYDPPSVFSFYRPGRKSSLLSTQFISARLQGLAALTAALSSDEGTATALDFDALQNDLPTGDPNSVAAYLLDALADPESTGLKDVVTAYLRENPDGDRIRGAASLIVSSAEYEVN